MGPRTSGLHARGRHPSRTQDKTEESVKCGFQAFKSLNRMLTWDERQRRAKLHREMKRLRVCYEPDLKKLKHNQDDTYERLLNEYLSERWLVEGQLGAIESAALVRKADRMSIPYPHQSDPQSWNRDMAGDYYLTTSAQLQLARSVLDASRKEVRWWLDALVPVLSLLVALAAVLTNQCG